ncbi:MAG: hypothetical protein IJT94_10150 [Oscillibacter sp.]|nr:hypothetical protein [Oscillibacter sp.]
MSREKVQVRSEVTCLILTRLMKDAEAAGLLKPEELTAIQERTRRKYLPKDVLI